MILYALECRRAKNPLLEMANSLIPIKKLFSFSFLFLKLILEREEGKEREKHGCERYIHWLSPIHTPAGD